MPPDRCDVVLTGYDYKRFAPKVRSQGSANVRYASACRPTFGSTQLTSELDRHAPQRQAKAYRTQNALAATTPVGVDVYSSQSPTPPARFGRVELNIECGVLDPFHPSEPR